MSKVNVNSKFLDGFGKDIEKKRKSVKKEQSEKLSKLKKSVDIRKEISGDGETLEEAQKRILNMKNSEKDMERLREVFKYMNEGKLGREQGKVGKRFTKAEALRMHSDIAESKRKERIKQIIHEMNTSKKDTFITVKTVDDLSNMLKDMKEAIDTDEITGFDIETFSGHGEGVKGGALNPYVGEVAGFSWTGRGKNYYLPLQHDEKVPINYDMTHDEIVDMCRPYLTEIKTVMHNAPFDCKWMLTKYNVDMTTNLVADTRVMSFMLNEEEARHTLKHLTRAWLKKPADDFESLFPKVDRFNEVPTDVATYYAGGDTEKVLELYWFIENIWNQERYGMTELVDLFYNVEMPVLKEFVHADLKGIKYDTEMSEKLYYELDEKLDSIKDEIYKMYGKEINMNSPKQVQEMIYDHFKLPQIGYTRSTSKKTLQELRGKHPIIQMILDYRAESKLQSSFTRPLQEKTVNGVIHPEHNTLGAKTGRFTCKNPNTQQIPSKRNEFRKQFVARDGHILMAIDYSQIELRVLAHDAEEQVLIKAFNEGRDIHSTTASVISGMSYEEIQETKDIDGSEGSRARDQAKIVNFGIVYGMTAAGLGKTLEVTKNQAQQIIDEYFRGYPGIKSYMDKRKREANHFKVVTDMFGRKRNFINQMNSEDKFVRYGAERQAGNFPIQSAAGIILKKAIVNLRPVLEKWGVSILLQVHDELIFECPADMPREAVKEIKETMENVVSLKVPIVADVDIYPERWAEGVDIDEWFKS